MMFSDVFQVKHGLTAIIGGGGKTTLLYRLAEELSRRGTVLVCSSTHIRRPSHLPVLTQAGEAAVRTALAASPVLCLGTEAEGGKLAAPELPFARLIGLADFVLVEADGAKMLPLKAHLAHESVIPPQANQTLLVAGADGFLRPIAEACHRAERFAALAGTTPEQPVTPEALAQVIVREGYGDRVFVNKAETPEQLAFARSLAALLPLPVFAGSLWKEELQCLS